VDLTLVVALCRVAAQPQGQVVVKSRRCIKMEVISYTKVMEAAREFGQALADCDECRAVKEGQETLRKDKEASKLLSDYQSTQRSIQTVRMWGGKTAKDKLEELRKLEAKINSNGIIQNLLDAQKRQQEVLGSLNTEVSNLLGINFASNSSAGGCC
jgi:cell fate (sporulation/competence/biofilm development) regulator YlbF (YheA/YmcA/DUF963 family)